jgi:23S rRNA (uracil1939-C5)-methyltransferase
MEFSIVTDRDGKRHLGLHMKGRFNDVTEIRECSLFRPWVGKLLVTLRPFLEKVEIGDGRASLKSLIVRSGTNSGEVMVNLLVENADPQLMGTGGWPEEFTRLVQDFFSGSDLGGDKLVSVYLTLITNRKGQRTTWEEKLLWGKPTFDEQIHLSGATLRFEVAPQAFLQPNTRQAERFYALIAKLADLRGGEKVLDLFCGTGTIGISLAAGCKDTKVRVTGLELNPAAIENARRNAALNGLGNIEFLVGDVSNLLPELCANDKPLDLIIVDPPRAGLTATVIEAICDSPARRLIYVSCNPPTLARDLKLFAARGWRLTFVQPVDQFSQTYHVETVVMMER